MPVVWISHLPVMVEPNTRLWRAPPCTLPHPGLPVPTTTLLSQSCLPHLSCPFFLPTGLTLTLLSIFSPTILLNGARVKLSMVVPWSSNNALLWQRNKKTKLLQRFFKCLQVLAKKQPETEMLPRLNYSFKLHGYFWKFEGHCLSDATIG